MDTTVSFSTTINVQPLKSLFISNIIVLSGALDFFSHLCSGRLTYGEVLVLVLEQVLCLAKEDPQPIPSCDCAGRVLH